MEEDVELIRRTVRHLANTVREMEAYTSDPSFPTRSGRLSLEADAAALGMFLSNLLVLAGRLGV